jgi:hypothetical protein
VATTTAPIADDYEAALAAEAGPTPPPAPPLTPGAAAMTAMELLATVRPDWREETLRRIAAVESQVLDAVETARLSLDLKLTDFIRNVGRLIRLRRILEARLGGVSSTGMSVELGDVIRIVKRWESGSELRTERDRLTTAARSALAGVNANVQDLMNSLSAGHHLGITGGSQTGETHEHDEFLRRAEALLTQRGALEAKIARLDPSGDHSRGELVTAAIAKAGVEGVLAALAAVAPAASTAALEKCLAHGGDLARTILAVDPATRRAAALGDEKAAQLATLARLQAACARERLAAGQAILDGGKTGRLRPVLALAKALKPVSPPLSVEIAEIAGRGMELASVISVLLEPER